VEVPNLAFARDDVAWLTRKVTAEENVSYLPNTNEVIGVYVTVGATIHLYSLLDRLQENAIYRDTDSVIYIQPGGQPWPITTGDNVGTCNLNSKPEVYSRVRNRRS